MSFLAGEQLDYIDEWDGDQVLLMILLLAKCWPGQYYDTHKHGNYRRKFMAVLVSVWSSLSFFITGKHYTRLSVNEGINLVLTDIWYVLDTQIEYLLSVIDSSTNILAMVYCLVRKMECFYRRDINAALPRLIMFRRPRPVLCWNHGVKHQSSLDNAIYDVHIDRIFNRVCLFIFIYIYTANIYFIYI